MLQVPEALGSDGKTKHDASARTLLTAAGSDPFARMSQLGHCTVTADTSGSDNDLATLLTAGSPTTALTTLRSNGLSGILVTVETNDVRVSFDDTDPSSDGLKYAKDNAQPYPWECSDFSKIRVAGQGGSATLRLHFFA